jgi:hypothetical protein
MSYSRHISMPVLTYIPPAANVCASGMFVILVVIRPQWQRTLDAQKVLNGPEIVVCASRPEAAQR